MTTLAEWYEDETHAIELAVLLKNPVLKAAITIVTTANCPVFRSGVALNDLALIHSFQAGVHHLPHALQVLTQPQPKHSAPLTEWEGEHILPSGTDY